MTLRMWMLDVAREQSPSYEDLHDWAKLSLQAGYNALGLYLEHRFAYPSLPWLAGTGAVTPELVKRLEEDFPDLQIIPFINLLGHFEGALYTEEGAQYAEEEFQGMQADPTNPGFVKLCESLVDDTIACFRSPIIHIGGDETWQLGVGEGSKRRVKEAEAEGAEDGKAALYGGHFGPLAQRVIDAGRRPAVWGDMFTDHPDALDLIPSETLLFDWQYFSGPNPPKSPHEKVYCPTLHTYNALWLHIPQSERNVVEHAAAAEADGAYGVCVTTWECGLFGNYGTLAPVIRASGAILNDVAEGAPAMAEAAVALLERNEFLRAKADIYRNTTIEGGMLALAGVREISEDPDARLARSIIERLIRDGEPHAAFVSTDRHGRVLYDSGIETALDVPAITGRRVYEQLTALLTISVDNLANGGPTTIVGDLNGQRFQIEARGTETPEMRRIDLSVVESPLLVAEHRSPHLRSIARYAATTEAPRFLKAYLQVSEKSEEWARLMGVELPKAGGIFAFSGIRSAIKARLLLYSNPSLLWLRNRKDLLGEPGRIAHAICERALPFAPGPNERGICVFGIKAIEFVRQVELAHKAYADHQPGLAMNHLAPCRQIFEDLEKVAVATTINSGGSKADVERCRIGRRWVEVTIGRIKLYGDGSLGYLPSFATICHPKFVPHDQANWWLINRWANE